MSSISRVVWIINQYDKYIASLFYKPDNFHHHLLHHLWNVVCEGWKVQHKKWMMLVKRSERERTAKKRLCGVWFADEVTSRLKVSQLPPRNLQLFCYIAHNITTSSCSYISSWQAQPTATITNSDGDNNNQNIVLCISPRSGGWNNIYEFRVGCGRCWHASFAVSDGWMDVERHHHLLSVMVCGSLRGLEVVHSHVVCNLLIMALCFLLLAMRYESQL